jgi:lysophospholipase L1-like esterase
MGQTHREPADVSGSSKSKYLVPGVAALVGLSALAHSANSPDDVWVGAWGFATTSFIATPAPTANAPALPPEFDNVTVRQLVRIVQPASRVRIRFSNEFGDEPLLIGTAHIALAGESGATIPGTDHALMFSGRPSSSIAPGAPLLSDPLDWKVPAPSRLAISVYLPQRTTPHAHRASEFVSAGGDYTGAEILPAVSLQRTGALVSEVDIVSPVAKHVVVTLGDSITEGFGSTVNEFRGWSDQLAVRLAQNRATRDWSVVNAGINSNRLLHNGPGTGALARFDRDALSVPGIAAIIVLEGINDIGYSHTVPSEAVTAEDMIAAYRQIIERSHARGVAVIGATIPPYEDAHYYVADGERMRQAVNAWIRTGNDFDGIVDFDVALRDPAHSARVKASLERGDHLHPNDAGYAVMANAIDLKLFSAVLKRHSNIQRKAN